MAEGGGGVWERLYNTAFETQDVNEWTEKVKTKQYTDARLRRAALYSLCSVTTDELRSPVLFTNVLGVNDKGRAHLSILRKSSDFPVISSNSQRKKLTEKEQRQLELSDFADSIYALLSGINDPMYFIKKSPVIF